MKSIATLLAGLIIGLIAGIFLYPKINVIQEDKTPIKKKIEEADTSDSPADTNALLRAPQQMLAPLAGPISPERAYDFFDSYHGISNQSTKSACFKITDKGEEKEIKSIYLPYEGFLEVIRTRVNNHWNDANQTNDEDIFLGLAGIPAYNEGKESHTLIWVPVVKGPITDSSYYYIPDQGYENLLIDYIDVCPPTCYVNDCILYQPDWKYDNSSGSNCSDPFKN